MGLKPRGCHRLHGLGCRTLYWSWTPRWSSSSESNNPPLVSKKNSSTHQDFQIWLSKNIYQNISFQTLRTSMSLTSGCPFYFRSFTRKTVVVEFLNFLSNPIPKKFYHPAMEFGLWLPNKLLCISWEYRKKNSFHRKFQGPNSGTTILIPLPYDSHKNPLKHGNGMGSPWETGSNYSGPWRIP